MDLSRVASVYQPSAGEGERHPGSKGWGAWVDRIIRPDIESGVRMFMLHNPASHHLAKGTGDYQWDQFCHLRDARPDLYTTFPVAFRPLVNAGVRIIAYIGRADTDPDLTRWKAPGRWDTWLNRMVESVKPIVDAGCELGCDASSALSADSPEWGFIATLRAMGVNVWVESRPTLGAVHQHKLDWISCEGTYQFQRGEPWAATDSQLVGRCLRWLDEPRFWGSRMRGEIERIQAESPRFVVGVPWEQYKPND